MGVFVQPFLMETKSHLHVLSYLYKPTKSFGGYLKVRKDVCNGSYVGSNMMDRSHTTSFAIHGMMKTVESVNRDMGIEEAELALYNIAYCSQQNELVEISWGRYWMKFDKPHT